MYTRNSLSKPWYTQSQNGLIVSNHLWSRNFYFPQGKVALIIITQFHDFRTKHAKYYPFNHILDSSETTPLVSHTSRNTAFRLAACHWVLISFVSPLCRDLIFFCTTLIRSDDVILTGKHSTGFSSSNPHELLESPGDTQSRNSNPGSKSTNVLLKTKYLFCWRSHELRCNLSQH